MRNKLKLFAALLGVACWGTSELVGIRIYTMAGDCATGEGECSNFRYRETGGYSIAPYVGDDALEKYIHTSKALRREQEEELKRILYTTYTDYENYDLKFVQIDGEDPKCLKFQVCRFQHTVYLLRSSQCNTAIQPVQFQKLPEEFWQAIDDGKTDVPLDILPENIQALIRIQGGFLWTDCSFNKEDIEVTVRFYDNRFYIDSPIIYPPIDLMHTMSYNLMNMDTTCPNGNASHEIVLSLPIYRISYLSLRMPDGWEAALRQNDKIVQSTKKTYLFMEDSIWTLLSLWPDDLKMHINTENTKRIIVTADLPPPNEVTLTPAYHDPAVSSWQGPTEVSWKEFWQLVFRYSVATLTETMNQEFEHLKARVPESNIL